MSGVRPYIVRQGDYVAKIAFQLGEDPGQIWKIDKNKPLTEDGRDPNLLAPGDVLRVPDRSRRQEVIALGGENNYQAQVAKTKVRLVLGDGSSRARSLKYESRFAGVVSEGTTSPEGELELHIPITVRIGEVFFPEIDHAIRIDLGGLDPGTERSGALQRLANLDYLLPSQFSDESAIAEACRRFQFDQKLPQTGAPDEETRDRLLRIHMA